ncbi:MAG: hypothetical protein E7356_00850 [Clostridiales bacterium]|nr:hypothetical protein [Clostridiales bacterium]
MRIKIESDVFDITDRIKEIDDGYFIVFNTLTSQYEVHNYKQENTYCFVVNDVAIDKRVLDKVYDTSIENIDNIIDDIAKNNIGVSKNCNEKILEQSAYQIREIYEYASSASRPIGDNVFVTEWR